MGVGDVAGGVGAGVGAVRVGVGGVWVGGWVWCAWDVGVVLGVGVGVGVGVTGARGRVGVVCVW